MFKCPNYHEHSFLTAFSTAFHEIVFKSYLCFIVNPLPALSVNVKLRWYQHFREQQNIWCTDGLNCYDRQAYCNNICEMYCILNNVSTHSFKPWQSVISSWQVGTDPFTKKRMEKSHLLRAAYACCGKLRKPVCLHAGVTSAQQSSSSVSTQILAHCLLSLGSGCSHTTKRVRPKPLLCSLSSSSLTLISKHLRKSLRFI